MNLGFMLIRFMRADLARFEGVDQSMPLGDGIKWRVSSFAQLCEAKRRVSRRNFFIPTLSYTRDSLSRGKKLYRWVFELVSLRNEYNFAHPGRTGLTASDCKF